MMALSLDEALAAIDDHSRALADASEGRLDASINSCPGWSMADLVAHLTEVQWFWATIAGQQLSEPADESFKPPRAADHELAPSLRAATAHLIQVLREADQNASVWTWAPTQMNIGFITRHQVQEAAVHHWDAVSSIGAPWPISPPVAADCIDEFLTFSVTSDAWPIEESLEPLNATFSLACNDFEASWIVTDGATPRTVSATSGRVDPAITACAADILLWLYNRGDVDESAVGDAARRLRQLTYTD